MSHVEPPAIKIGSLHCVGSGEPEVMSEGMFPRGKNQTLTLSLNHSIASNYCQYSRMIKASVRLTNTSAIIVEGCAVFAPGHATPDSIGQCIITLRRPDGSCLLILRKRTNAFSPVSVQADTIRRVFVDTLDNIDFTAQNPVWSYTPPMQMSACITSEDEGSYSAGHSPQVEEGICVTSAIKRP